MDWVRRWGDSVRNPALIHTECESGGGHKWKTRPGYDQPDGTGLVTEDWAQRLIDSVGIADK